MFCSFWKDVKRFNPEVTRLNFSCHLITLNGRATIVVFGRLRVKFELSKYLHLSLSTHLKNITIVIKPKFMKSILQPTPYFITHNLSDFQCVLYTNYVRSYCKYHSDKFHIQRCLYTIMDLWNIINELIMIPTTSSNKQSKHCCKLSSGWFTSVCSFKFQHVGTLCSIFVGMKCDCSWKCWGIYMGIVVLYTCSCMKMEQSVLKRWHLNYSRRWITQKKAYGIQNTAKVWNQE
jgi:hypothetical protein